MMHFRRLNDAGIEAFRSYLDRLREDPSLAPPYELLADQALSEPLTPGIEAEEKHFESRMDFALWLYTAAEQAGYPIPRNDPGFWAWLSLALFDQVCPPDSQGKRKPKENARYLAVLHGARRYYRHGLLGPYLVFIKYADNPEQVSALLCGSLTKLTDEAYRLFVENQLVDYKGAVAILKDLYYDPAKGKIKRGAQTKKAGSIRRFVKILFQYVRTFDLDVLPEQALREMLPPEFDRWRSSSDIRFKT